MLKKVEKIFNNITGVSCPIFGISWNPTVDQQKIAKDIINYLEAKKVLYNPYECEIVDHCVHSIIEIRNYLIDKLPDIKEKEKLYEYVKAMRNACNRFLTQNFDSDDFRRSASRYGNINNWTFLTSLGELRANFGIMIGQISLSYNAKLDDNLMTIVPIDDENNN